MREVARGRATLAIRRRGHLDLVTAKNDAIARRLADQSARGSSTTSTTDLVSMPPWAISARNSSSTAPAHGQISGLHGQISGLIDVGPRGPLQYRGLRHPAFEPPVDRRARRTKTDIIDVEMLLRTLMAWPRASLESLRWFRSRPRPMRKHGARSGIGGRDRASGGGPDRLGDLQPPGRDDVSAPAVHSRPELLPQAGLRASCSRSGPALSLQALPRGL